MNNNYLIGLIKKYELIIFFLFSFVFLFLLSMQGFDLADSGFVLAGYQNFYTNPELASNLFYYYLCGIIGGVFHLVFPNGGLLYFRIINNMFLLGSIWISYLLLKQYVTKNQFIVGSVFYLFFVSVPGILPLHYDTVTQFFSLVSLFFLVKGLNRNILLFVGGFILGINCFTDLTNVLFVVLGLILFFNAYYQNQNIKKLFNQILIMIGGFSFGFCILFLIIILLGHGNLMSQKIVELFTIAGGETTHGVSNLINNYLNNYLKIFQYMIGLIGIYVIYSISMNLKKRWIQWIVLSLIVSVLLISFYKMINFANVFYALTFLVSSLVLFSAKFDKQLKILIIGNLIIMFLGPIGADEYTNFSPHALSVSFPLFLFIASKSINFRFSVGKLNYILTHKRNRIFIQLFLSGILLINLYNITLYAYFDPGSRLNKVYSIESKYTKGVYTTKHIADVTNTILNKLTNEYIKPGDTIFAYADIPMIYYLTETIPFVNSYWTFDVGNCSNSQLEKLISDNVKVKKLPLVLVQKFYSLYKFFPPVDDYKKLFLHGSAMFSFLESNNYYIDWENEYFAIYLPGENRKE